MKYFKQLISIIKKIAASGITQQLVTVVGLLMLFYLIYKSNSFGSWL